jgi:hypothetical protein
MSDDCVSLGEGGVRFYDNYVPTLGAGDYLVNVAQQVNPLNADIDDSWTASQVFSVAGPRYVVPPDDFFSISPPQNAQGVFDQFLPHVVLAARDLPWERNVFEDDDPELQTPWLALLLFVDDEEIEGQPSLLAPAVTGWLRNQTMSASLTAYDLHHHDSGDGILWPELQLEWYESDEFLRGTGCTVIDVAPAAFSALVASAGDLRYLAHVRQVQPWAKDDKSLQINGDGWYSVIVGNRLPDAPPAGSGQPGRRNIVHLVSLEGLAKYAGGASSLPDGTTRVRMVSFKSWSFTCLPEAGESFAELMIGLLRDGRGGSKSTTFTLPTDPRAVETAPVAFAAEAIGRGYVPVRYQTRLGEETFGWYRGPCAPVPTRPFLSPPDPLWDDAPPDDSPGPIGTASGALVYDPALGVFDVSYAVAWETGRLMALADGWFGRTVLAWERQAHRTTDHALERQAQRALSENLPAGPGSVRDGLRRHRLTDGFVARTLTTVWPSSVPAPAGEPGARPATAWADAPAQVSRDDLVALLALDEVRDAIAADGANELTALAGWLARRYLLEGVPFDALVPHAALLPPESVRFFYVDANWLDALADGAMSIGIQSGRDRELNSAMKPHVRTAMRAAVSRARPARLAALATGDPLALTPPPPALPAAGMLMRSAAVSGWPGLEVRAFGRYTADSGEPEPDIGTTIAALRIDRLAADILLVLWPQVPTLVTLDEPGEGLAFGFEDPPNGSGDWAYLRSIGSTGYGMPLCSDAQIEEGTCAYSLDAVAAGALDAATRVVKVAGAGGLVSAMEALLPAGPGGAPAVRVRDFAVQMVKVPERAVFASLRPPQGGER